MNYITALIEHYLSIPVEKFTDKLISAFQIAEIGGFDKKEVAELEFIERYTDKEILVNFYKLDRTINPDSRGFSSKQGFAIFKQDSKEGYNIRLPEQQIQKVLCHATRLISQNVMRNTKDYNLEFKMPSKNSNNSFKVEF